MENFKIHLPIDSYTNNDFGEFCVQLGNFYFPSREWTDFGETLVFSWRDRISKLLSEQTTKVRCKFMDGNYRIDIEETKEENFFKVSLIRDANDLDKIEYQADVDKEQFLEEILRAIKSIQEECKRNNNFAAVERIETGVQEFQKARLSYFNSTF